ncbi:MAG TPA: pilus assembly protein TadG-related protein, partial [Oligoflexia bacterium]|nr:pilus assembly protein TadG-related protein [Oligoflexia bacterium]
MSSGLLRPRKRKQLQGAAEKGAVIIIGVFAFVLLLAFAALAIDAGNVYRAQVQLQKAVDLAAIEGPAATVLTARRYDPATLGREPVPDDEVVERMKAVLQHNAVTIGGLTLVNPELPGVRFLRIPASALNPANHAIVEAQVRVTLLLMHVVPFTMFGIRNDSGHSVVLTARAEAQRPSANVALVLDTSDSMRCPSGCACLCQTHAGHPLHKHNCAAEAAGCATATGYQKYQDLQDAVQKFLEFFDEDYDRISLVPYNLAGEVRANIRTKTATPNQGFDRADLFCKLGIRNPKSPDGSTATPNPKCSGGPRADDFMVPALMGSSTNPSSALFHAYADMRTAGIIDTPPSQFDEQAFYILFTDGAPDAGQFLFDAASNNPAVRGSLPPVTVSDFNSDYDYSHYALEWVYAPTAPGGTGGHFPAPGRLV